MRFLSFKNNLMLMAFVLLMGVSDLVFAMSQEDEKQSVSKKRHLDDAEDKF